MNSMKKRILIVVVALVAIAGLLACSTGSLISQTQPTATPTKTPKPTFTATWTPTITPIPTDTPTPTSTATATPEATNTPLILTATPTDTPPPTDTPVPTVPPTNTPRPTAKPTRRPAPTNTPKPAGPTNTPVPQWPYRGMIAGGSANCGGTGVKGTIKTGTGSAVPGVTVAVWADGWEGTVSNASNTAGQWDVSHWPFGPKPGTWHVRVVRVESCNKKPDGNGYTAICTEWLSNMVDVVTTANCTGEGAVQWPVVDFIKQ